MTERNGTAAGRSRAQMAIIIAASALAAALLVVIVVVVQAATSTCGGWFSHLSATTSDECVGVLQEGDLVDQPDGVGDLINRFHQANADVAKKPDAYVKIVLLTPLTLPAGDAPAPMSRVQILSSLRGAFTAMARANDVSAVFGSPNAPRLQVVLANQGSKQDPDSAESLADAIVSAGEPDHPVLAVVGLGSSLPGTAAVATELAKRHIPMVSAVASADSLNGVDMRGLRSVSPSNTDYARALREYLDAQTTIRSGIVVADQNNDLYTSSLKDAFDAELEPYIRFPQQSFSGGTIDTGGVAANAFFNVVSNLCGANGLDAVFYAGRVADFNGFLDTMSDRICKERPIAVLVGATGFGAVQSREQELNAAKITVVYASSSDAPAWIDGSPAAPADFAGFLQRFKMAFPDQQSKDALADGYAISYHDALVSAAVAVRLAGQNVRPPGVVPSAADVEGQFKNVSLTSAVRGASGTLSFPPGARDRAEEGRAVGKLVPLRQIGLSTPVRLPIHGCVHVTGGSPCVPS